jgi:hypothetical protein
LCDDNVLRRLAFRIGHCPSILDLRDHVHAFDDIAEDDVFSVQVGCAALGSDDEELTAVSVGPTGLSVYANGLTLFEYTPAILLIISKFE